MSLVQTLPPDAALREAVPFSLLDLNIPRYQWLFQASASSLSFCPAFLLSEAEIDPAIPIELNKIPSFHLHNKLPQVYNQLYYRWASFTFV
jgi:hypothetical protein